jgi:hypothetical protein
MVNEIPTPISTIKTADGKLFYQQVENSAYVSDTGEKLDSDQVAELFHRPKENTSWMAIIEEK